MVGSISLYLEGCRTQDARPLRTHVIESFETLLMIVKRRKLYLPPSGRHLNSTYGIQACNQSSAMNTYGAPWRARGREDVCRAFHTLCSTREQGH